MNTNLTIHTIVKNEPFIYYAIKSVYEYCDKILLYDTGSTDEHTLKDIYQLLREDYDRKILFKTIPVAEGEELWSVDNINGVIEERRGLLTKGKVRQRQIEDTKTKYFMIVDGDEVHYKEGMKSIVNELLPNDLYGKLCVGLPLTWFYDLEHTFSDHTFPYNGRIMPTDEVYMNNDSPNEKHLMKKNGGWFTYEHPDYLCWDSTTPYAHFETVIKPWRRKHLVSKENIKQFTGQFPEVMVKNPDYLNRYKKGK